MECKRCRDYNIKYMIYPIKYTHGFVVRCCVVVIAFFHVDSCDTFHDNVIKWKHFWCYWPFVRGIHWSPMVSPHKDQWRGALVFCLICAWTNGWTNNRDAGDLRRHRSHHDVTKMCPCCLLSLRRWLFKYLLNRFAVTEAMIWFSISLARCGKAILCLPIPLPQCQWSNPDRYGQNHFAPNTSKHNAAMIFSIIFHWASSTGLTAVSKFKPRLPAQWAVGTHRKGPSRMEKVTFTER